MDCWIDRKTDMRDRQMNLLENGWINRLTDIQIHGWTEQDGLIYRQTDTHTHTHTHREMDRYINGWIDRQAGHTNRHTDGCIDRQTDTEQTDRTDSRVHLCQSPRPGLSSPSQDRVQIGSCPSQVQGKMRQKRERKNLLQNHILNY